jgi:hypothetical protein
MSNDNQSAEIRDLAIRTSAAFMTLDMLARVLEQNGVISRDKLSDGILEIVSDRLGDIMDHNTNARVTMFKDVLSIVKNFAKSELKQA